MTVKENKEGYTQREVERAQMARRLYHAMGAPTPMNLKYALRQNLIQNCPVTVDDVVLAEKIYGPDISTLKGRSTRRKALPMREDYIEIPPSLVMNHLRVTLCVDLMFINSCIFLTAIDKSVKHRGIAALEARTMENIRGGLEAVIRLYNKADFKIAELECDGEFRPLIEAMADDLDVNRKRQPKSTCPRGGAQQ